MLRCPNCGRDGDISGHYSETVYGVGVAEKVHTDIATGRSHIEWGSFDSYDGEGFEVTLVECGDCGYEGEEVDFIGDEVIQMKLF